MRRKRVLLTGGGGYIPFWIILVLGLVGFFFLAFKNPFSAHSIIPNLEPYPDTLYYATPAWNFVHGKGFTMSFVGHNVSIITPPLYSIYLIPFLSIFNDVRAFYFANMLLMLSSTILFFFICKKIFGKDLFGSLLTGFLGFFLVTNLYVYTLPTLLLAENITFFLTVYGIYLLISNFSKTKSVLIGMVGILLVFVKFSNLPLFVALYFLYVIKTFKNKKDCAFFGVISAIFIILFSIYYFYSQSREGSALNFLPVFSSNYFTNHLTFYLKALFGGENIFLWFRDRMVVPVIGILTLLGMFLGFYNKESRKTAMQMFITVFLTIIFMSFFYVVDTRYIFATYPAVLILAGLAIVALKNMTNPKIAILLMIIIIAFVLFVPNQGQKAEEVMAMTLVKKTVGNIRGNETAWYYVAISEFNKYFAQNHQNKDVYLGTFLPPFFVDFYANGNYKYLPLSKEQDFFSAKGGLSEKLKIGSIDNFYTRFLDEGNLVYVSNVYVGNLQAWAKEFEALKTKFEFKLVHRGCLDSCNLYKLEIK